MNDDRYKLLSEDEIEGRPKLPQQYVINSDHDDRILIGVTAEDILSEEGRLYFGDVDMSGPFPIERYGYSIDLYDPQNIRRNREIELGLQGISEQKSGYDPHAMNRAQRRKLGFRGPLKARAGAPS